MPGTNPVSARRDVGDAEGTVRRCFRRVRMIEHGDPGASPGVLLAHDFYLRRLPKDVVERYDLARIVERCNRLDHPGSDVDEAVGVNGSVVARDVERARSVNHLDVGIESAFVVGDLETPLEGQAFAATNVGQPDERATDARSRARDSRLQYLSSANVLIQRRTNDRVRRYGTVEINRAGDVPCALQRNDSVRFVGRRDHRGARSYPSGSGLAVARPRGSGVVPGAGCSYERNCGEERGYYMADMPAKHQLLIEVRSQS